MAHSNRVWDPLNKAALLIEGDNAISANIYAVWSYQRSPRRRVTYETYGVGVGGSRNSC
jgi:hypothetical protein